GRFNHALQLAMLQVQSLGGTEYPMLPSHHRGCRPTTPLESAGAHGVNSASARSAGKSSPCQPEPQAAFWRSSSVLPSPAGTTTDATTYGRAPSCRLTERSRPICFGDDPDLRAIPQMVCR